MLAHKTFQIVPDRTVDNKRGHEFARGIHDYLYKSWFKRIRDREQPERLWYVMRLTSKEITFHLVCAERSETFVKQRLARYWERCAVIDQTLAEMTTQDTETAEMHYVRHNIFALSADWREDTVPISSIMGVLRDMRDGDEARVILSIAPYNRTAWQDWSERAHNEFKDGRTPQRRGVASRLSLKNVAKALDNALLETNDIASTLFDDATEARQKDNRRQRRHRPDMEKREIMLDGRLCRETLLKRNEPVFRSSLFIVSHSADRQRRTVALRSLTNAFSDLAGDNDLKRVEHGKQSAKIVARLNRFQVPFTMDANLMSCSEIGKLIQLPTAALQEEYSEFLSTIERRETGVPDKLLKARIVLGSVSFRGNTFDVGIPISDWDELCLPRAVIGAMGTGKTSGFGGNFGAYALQCGYSVFSIDVAKDELGDEISIGRRALRVPDDREIRLDFGERAIRLDWVEAMGGKRAANRLAGEVLNFFNLHGAEAGVETARYIRLAAKTIGLNGGSLDEMMRLFTDPEYRKTCVSRVKKDRPDLANEWRVYDALSDGMRGKVTDPILNRLDMLLGDDYLRECFKCQNGVDFRKYMSGGYHVRIYVPKRDLGPETTDILVDFLMSKIELAMFARDESEQVPCFVLADEPHQFVSCAPRWERMVVESRKWRVGLVFMFHLWDQVPKKLTNSIKAAGSHFHVYTTSKQILRDLAEEIDPFTVEEALKTPRHYAINVIRAGGENVTPFIAHMSAPPSKWAKTQNIVI